MFRSPTGLTLAALLVIAGVASSGTMYVDENPAGFSSVTPNGDDLILAMWDQQFSFDLEAITGALGNAGAEFDGTYFYSGRWASDLFHEVDLAFSLVREFSIPGVSGVRDLAYDGTYFYGGASGTTIYEMDFATSTLVSSVSNNGLSVRAIAYNGDNDTFYSSNWADPVNESDRAGNIVSTFNLVTTTSTYGMAYESHCTGIGYLWVFDQTAGGAVLHQWDVVAGAYTGTTYDVAADFTNSGIAGGAWFYAGYLPDTGTIGGLLQGQPDIGFGYELCGPPQQSGMCFQLEPFCNQIHVRIDTTWGFIEGYDDDCGSGCNIQLGGILDPADKSWVLFFDFQDDACGHVFEFAQASGDYLEGAIFRYYADGSHYENDPTQITLVPCAEEAHATKGRMSQPE